MNSNSNPEKNSDDNQLKFPWGSDEDIEPTFNVDSHIEGSEHRDMWEIWDDDWVDLEDDTY